MIEHKLRDVEDGGTITVTEDGVNVPNMVNPPVVLEMGIENGICRINHREGDYELGFDLTSFPDSNTFIEVLERIDLNPYWNYYRVHEDGRFYYVWANDHGMVLCGNNPITGDFRELSARRNQRGYASYIGVEGTEDFVDAALQMIVQFGNYKDIDRNNRSFI